jgi:glycosyltransferase involved in cell wall biosynthesis
LHIHLDFDLNSLRWALQRPPDLIVSCANFMVNRVRDALPENARRRQRIETIPNAVDLERYKPADKAAAKARLGVRREQPLILMMANLSPHKGQETAVRAVASLRNRGITVKLLLAGVDRSPQQVFHKKLQCLIDDLGVQDCVTLLGFRQDGSQLLQSADAVLLPSTSEGLPLTLLEAQACEVPVIAAPTAGVPEIVRDGDTGFLVAADDVEGYASRIELLINRPEVGHRITKQAAERCRGAHNWELYQRRFFELYGELLAG